MTRQNGLVILTISFYFMYGYIGMPGQGAFAIPFLLNETVLAIVSGIMVYYHFKNPKLAIGLALLSLSALAISPFFLEIIIPQNGLIDLFESGWYEVLRLLHYIVICALMILLATRKRNKLRQILHVSAILLFIAGVSFGVVWIFLLVYMLMVAAEFTKGGENNTVPLWILMAFLELTKVIALLMS